MSVWSTGDPPIPGRRYICYFNDGNGAWFELGTWHEGRWWWGDPNHDEPTAWMFLPDGPDGPGAGHPRPAKVRM